MPSSSISWVYKLPFLRVLFDITFSSPVAVLPMLYILLSSSHSFPFVLLSQDSSVSIVTGFGLQDLDSWQMLDFPLGQHWGP
jgi:hypothetical protein